MVVELALTETKLITGEELAAMGDIEPCELIEGRIAPMSPTGNKHGSCEGNFYYALRSFADSHRLGKVRVGEVGIYTRRHPDTVHAADVLFLQRTLCSENVFRLPGRRARFGGRGSIAKRLLD